MIEPALHSAPDAEELAVLRHALGLRADGSGRAYRDHFVTGPGSDDYDACVRLVGRGLMTQHKASALTGGDPWFRVTSEGRVAAARAV